MRVGSHAAQRRGFGQQISRCVVGISGRGLLVTAAVHRRACGVAERIIPVLEHTAFGVGLGNKTIQAVIGVYGLVLVAVDHCRLVACKVVFVLGCMVQLVGFLDLPIHAVIRILHPFVVAVGVLDQIAVCIILIGRIRIIRVGFLAEITGCIIGVGSRCTQLVRSCCYSAACVVGVGNNTGKRVGFGQHIAVLVIGVGRCAAVFIGFRNDTTQRVISRRGHAAFCVCGLEQVIVFVVGVLCCIAFTVSGNQYIAYAVILLCSRITQSVNRFFHTIRTVVLALCDYCFVLGDRNRVAYLVVAVFGHNTYCVGFGMRSAECVIGVLGCIAVLVGYFADIAERIVGIAGFAAVRIGDNRNLVFAVVLIRSFVAFRVSDGELVAVRIIGGSSLTAEFVIAFCRASQRVIHRAGLAAVCVNLLYGASQQVIDILCHIAFGVGNTKLIARKVVGVRGNAAECVRFGQQPSYLVVSVGGFVAFAVNLLYRCIDGVVLGLGFIAVCVRCDKQIANRVIGIGCLVACTVGFRLGSSERVIGVGFLVAFCVGFRNRASHAVIRIDRFAVQRVNRLCYTVERVIFIGSRIAFRVRSLDKQAAIVVGVAGFVALCVCYRYKLCGILVIFIGGFVAICIRAFERFAVRAVFGRYRAAERVLGRGGKAVGIVLIRGFAAQRVYGFQQLARLGVSMPGRCSSRITHLGMLCNDAAYGIVFKAGNTALSVGDRKLPSLIVIRIGGLIAECVRNRNRQTECIIGVRSGMSVLVAELGQAVSGVGIGFRIAERVRDRRNIAARCISQRHSGIVRIANFRHIAIAVILVCGCTVQTVACRVGAIIAVIGVGGGVFRAVDNCSDFLDVAVVIVVVARFKPISIYTGRNTRFIVIGNVRNSGNVRIDKCLLYHTAYAVILVLNIDFAFKVGGSVQIAVAIIGIVQRITVRIGNAGQKIAVMLIRYGAACVIGHGRNMSVRPCQRISACNAVNLGQFIAVVGKLCYLRTIGIRDGLQLAVIRENERCAVLVHHAVAACRIFQNKAAVCQRIIAAVTERKEDLLLTARHCHADNTSVVDKRIVIAVSKASTQRTLVVARVVNTKEGQRDNAFQLQVLVHEVVRTCYHVYRVKVLVVQHQAFQFGETGQFIARQTAADKLLVQLLAYFIGQTAVQHEERRRAIFTDNIITVVYQQFGTDSKLFLAVLLLLRPSIVLTVRVAIITVGTLNILIRSAERFNFYGQIKHIFIEVRTDNRNTIERAVPYKRVLHHGYRLNIFTGKVLVCLINAVLGQFYQTAVRFGCRCVGRYHSVR